MQNSKQVACTILQQLGGRVFLAFTGSHTLISYPNGCAMYLRKNIGKVNRLKITLNGKDLYDVKFFYFRANYKSDKGYSESNVQEFNDIYFDQLQALFTQVTGLLTKF